MELSSEEGQEDETKQRDDWMGHSQGKMETGQGSMVSSRGVEEFGKIQHDNCYFLFGKILFCNVNTRIKPNKIFLAHGPPLKVRIL